MIIKCPFKAKIQKIDHAKSSKFMEINVGKWIMRWYPPSANENLGLGWTGPCLIVYRISDLSYQIPISLTSEPRSVHIDHLKYV